MGKHNTQKKEVVAETPSFGDLREQLVHRQLQWLVFWTCVFLVAGAFVGLEDSTWSIQASEWTRIR